MGRLTLSLWQNAASFLAEGLSRAVAAERDETQWKFAIFNLVQAIELAMKERLRQEHPLLIYGDIDNPKTTVTLEKALSRLGRIPSVKLTVEDIKNVQLAAGIRNAVVHHEVDVSVEQVQVVFGTLFGFIAEFSRRQLGIELSTEVSDSVWTSALAIDRHLTELRRRATQQLTDEGIPLSNRITYIRYWHDT